MSFRQLIRHRGIMGTASAAVAVVIAGGVFAAVSPGSSHEALVSVSDNQPASGTVKQKPAPAKPLVPLRVLSVTPAGGTQDANGAAPIKITFNEQLAATSPRPTLSPQVEGTWSIDGDTATFQPAVGYITGTHVKITIPGGKAGVQAAGLTSGGTSTLAATNAGLLAKSATVSFTTGAYSTLRLQELLTQLGYLPLTWSPADPTATAISSGDANAQLSAAYDPPNGSFTFKSGYPSALTSQWATGKSNKLVMGAIMAFENDHGLNMDGDAGPEVWAHLLTAVADNKTNQNGYTYSLVSQASPETLRVYHNGQLIQKTLVNTGIPGRSTEDGTFPVYLRYPVTIMQGTNPDGSKYKDTVYWVSYFDGSNALHYFPRYGYGYYQSLGCVEMPLTPAKYIWQYTTYGSLVTVEGPVA